MCRPSFCQQLEADRALASAQVTQFRLGQRVEVRDRSIPPYARWMLGTVASLDPLKVTVDPGFFCSGDPAVWAEVRPAEKSKWLRKATQDTFGRADGGVPPSRATHAILLSLKEGKTCFRHFYCMH